MTKCTLLCSLLALFSFTLLSAQKNELAKGDWYLSGGVGLVPTYVADGGSTTVPPLTARLEYQLSDKVTVGAFAAYSKSVSDAIHRPNGTSNIYTSAFTITGLRLAANTNKIENWNFYGGLSLAYSMPQVETETFFTEPDNSRDDFPTAVYGAPAKNQFVYSAYVGATYFLGNQLGIYSELGYGVTLLNAGITYRL